MNPTPLNYLIVEPQNTIGAAEGVYVHALELAAWLLENGYPEPAGHLEQLVAEDDDRRLAVRLARVWKLLQPEPIVVEDDDR